MQIQLVSRVNTKAMLPGWGGRYDEAYFVCVCWRSVDRHTHMIMTWFTQSTAEIPHLRAEEMFSTTHDLCLGDSSSSCCGGTMVPPFPMHTYCSFYLVTVLKCDNVKCAQTAGERIPICFFTLSHCFPPSCLFAFTSCCSFDQVGSR